MMRRWLLKLFMLNSSGYGSLMSELVSSGCVRRTSGLRSEQFQKNKWPELTELGKVLDQDGKSFLVEHFLSPDVKNKFILD